jgi:hypothetical protein
MSARNVAVVVSPNLYRCKTIGPTDPLQAMVLAQAFSSFTQKLLEARMVAMMPDLDKHADALGG